MIYYVLFLGLMTLDNIREVLTVGNSECFIDNLNKTKVKWSVQGHISDQIQRNFQHVREAYQENEDTQTPNINKKDDDEGGMDTSKAPYFAEIITKDEAGQKVICFASIVDNCHILTAAHCVTSKITYEPKALYRVLNYEEILISHGGMDAEVHDVAKEVWIHPQYLQKPEVRLYKDVALIRTSIMTFSNLVQKVPIHPVLDVGDFSPMKKCLIADETIGELTFNLIPVTLISQKQCKAIYKDMMDEDDQFCAVDVSEDWCYLEEGSGLFCEGKLLAVASWGVKLDDYKTEICVFSRVDTALKLIAPELDKVYCKAASFSPTLTTLLNLILLHCTQYY